MWEFHIKMPVSAKPKSTLRRTLNDYFDYVIFYVQFCSLKIRLSSFELSNSFVHNAL